MRNVKLFLAALLLTVGLVAAKEIYVSPRGDDSADGTRTCPLHTPSKAIGMAQSGDTVYFLEGRYSEPIAIQGLRGTEEQPITLAAAPDQKVFFDGTDLLPDRWEEVTPDSPAGKLIQPAQWQRIKGKLFCQRLAEPIFALIYDNRLMSDARWPDSGWDDPWRLDRYMVLRRASVESAPGALYDGLPTENAFQEAEKWVVYDRSQLKHRNEMLADTELSFQDAIVVLSHTWGSWGSRILEHRAGSNRFKYDTTFSDSGSIQEEAVGFLNNRLGWDNLEQAFGQSSHGGIHFFFMGLPALDNQEEWWYHEPSSTLYFIAPGGQKPEAGKVRGKRRDFQLTVRNCRHLQIKGIEFFGGAALLEDCEHSRLEDCTFRFGSYHKFSVGDFDMPVTTRIVNQSPVQAEEKLYGNSLINCRFTYLDGNAFEGRSTGLTIDNVLIYRTQQTTLGLDSRSMSIDRPLLVRRVTIDDVGASVGIKGGGIDSVYELNNITRFGGLQYDGASLQMGGREKYIYRYNWSHDHPKRSYRFDAGSYPSYANAYGEMSYNVAWNTPGGFSIKGDDHLIHNNVLIGDASFDLFNMKRWASKNERTVVANNIVRELFAGTYDWDKPVIRKSTQSRSPETSDTFWMEESIVPKDQQEKLKEGMNPDQVGGGFSLVLAVRKNNYMADPREVLRDPGNLDFRPKRGATLIDGGYRLSQRDVPWKKTDFTGANQVVGNGPDIGAYEYGADHYWIPGFRYEHASTPVPPDGTHTAKPDCDLMWLGGYKARRHHLYVGSSQAEIVRAGPESSAYKGVFEGRRNIYSFPQRLSPGSTVYWRVDAERDGQTIPGPVWSFSVE